MASLLASSLLPERFRGATSPEPVAAPPSWLKKKLTPVLQLLSRVACLHPIHTLVVVALLASTTYVGLLQESLFDASGPASAVGRADWSSLLEGSRRLRTGPENGWKWQPVEAIDPDAAVGPEADHTALLTLAFPDSPSSDSSGAVPPPRTVPTPANISVARLPATASSFASYTLDTTLAFAVPFAQAPSFLSATQEISSDAPGEARQTAEHGREERMWIMKAARVKTRSSVVHWARNAWSEFLDLLKNAESLDIFIMSLGYLAMHLTFVSLFVSMRRMGSNFWLAMSTLLSSVFAFLFGLIVTAKLGVPISVVLLSEGLPFLVVTIGFEKNIALTRAVLSHAVEHRRPAKQMVGGRKAGSESNAIQYAVQAAIRERGYEIVRDYVVEIAILVLGAASGVQGGLQQFCFLAAWILFFDGLLLFTFYMAILSIKLEINRIKRHVDMRRALEDDGVSRRVAENVARAGSSENGGDDGGRGGGGGGGGGVSGGGGRGGSGAGASNGSSPVGASSSLKSISVPKFKVLMVSGFVLVNAVNLCTIPFRSSGSSFTSISSWARALGGVGATLPVDPFKVAANGLDALLAAAHDTHRAAIVTVLTPIKYELEYPSVHYALPGHAEDGLGGYLGSYGVGGRMVGSLLESLEDPVLSKWIVVALAMSVALNGYLFNAARWGIKDPNVADHLIDRNDLARAQRFNEPGAAQLVSSEFSSSLPRGKPASELPPPDPATTDDEGEHLRRLQSLEGASAGGGPEEGEGRAQVDTGADANRSLDILEKMIREKRVHDMSDEEVVAMSLRGKIPGYALERSLQDFTRAVKVRRSIISRTKATTDLTHPLEHSKLPYESYNWERVFGACCENVIGYMPLPVGVAGPLVIDGQSYFVPMATTEGVLVASTSRGSKAINAGGGAVTVLTSDGMTRGPCVSFETLERAGAAKLWLDSDEGQATMRRAFNSTSNFARLQSMKTAIAGTYLYIRFKTSTGDAMGMNMISKGVEYALNVMATESGFEDMVIISLSGNYCTDKKAAAINWIDGRGKGVVAEAIIPGDVVRTVLKSDVDSLVELGMGKNFIGSAMAGAIGGFNAHAANIVAAVFIATGQDPAQVVESSNCITIMKNLRGSLQISVSMPSLEVGTLGGGTILEPQSAMLDMLGVRGPHLTTPGENARRLARIVAAATLAGELSLCAALAAGHLVRAHMQHNRSAPPTRTGTPAPPAASGSMTPVGLAMTSVAEKATR